MTLSKSLAFSLPQFPCLPRGDADSTCYRPEDEMTQHRVEPLLGRTEEELTSSPLWLFFPRTRQTLIPLPSRILSHLWTFADGSEREPRPPSPPARALCPFLSASAEPTKMQGT